MDEVSRMKLRIASGILADTAHEATNQLQAEKQDKLTQIASLKREEALQKQQYEQKISDYEKQLTELKQELNASEVRNKEQNERLTGQNSIIAQYKQAVADDSKTSETLRRENQVLQGKLLATVTTKDTLREQLEAALVAQTDTDLLNEFNEKTIRVVELERIEESLQQQIKLLQSQSSQSDRIAKELTSKSEECSKLSSQLAEITGEYKELKKNTSGLDIDYAKNTIADQKKKIDELNEKCRSVDTTAQELSQVRQEFDEFKREAEQDKVEYAEGLGKLRCENEKQKKLADDLLKSEKERVARRNSEISKLKKLCESCTCKKQKTPEGCGGGLSKSPGAQSVLASNAESKIKLLESQISELKEQKEELSKQLLNLREELRKQQETNRNLTNDKRKALRDNELLRKQNKAHVISSNHDANLVKENRQQFERINTLEKEKNDITALHDSLVKKNTILKLDYKKAQDELVSKRSQITSFQTEIISLKDNLAVHQAELAKISAQLTDTQNRDSMIKQALTVWAKNERTKLEVLRKLNANIGKDCEKLLSSAKDQFQSDMNRILVTLRLCQEDYAKKRQLFMDAMHDQHEKQRQSAEIFKEFKTLHEQKMAQINAYRKYLKLEDNQIMPENTDNFEAPLITEIKEKSKKEAEAAAADKASKSHDAKLVEESKNDKPCARCKKWKGVDKYMLRFTDTELGLALEENACLQHALKSRDEALAKRELEHKQEVTRMNQSFRMMQERSTIGRNLSGQSASLSHFKTAKKC